MKADVYKYYRFNFSVNMLDGGFFGLAIGLASFMTVLPLFVSTLTDSAILIGLIPAIHSVGWQLPQLFTADRVSRLTRYKPMVVWMTIHERLPFLGLALVAWMLPKLGTGLALALIYGLLIWQGLGGGFTATAWQSMIGKIIPANRRGTFYGSQGAVANLLASGGALAAGALLLQYESPIDFALCFLFAGIAMMASMIFLASTREPETPPEDIPIGQGAFWGRMMDILRQDADFRTFLAVRMLSQFAVMAFAFYTVYAVRQHGMTEGIAGIMMSVYTFGQIIAHPLMGWIGDRWSHPAVMKLGALAAVLSASLAWLAPSLSWFYVVFTLAGIANVTIWTNALTMTLQFGSEADRPVYIGMANTLIAPATILAPLIGGWLADISGFQTTFLTSAVCGLGTALLLQLSIKKARPTSQSFRL